MDDLSAEWRERCEKGRKAAEAKGQYDCPPEVIEVRRDSGGALDEICAGDPTGKGLFVHLEQMSPDSWWLGIYKDGYRQTVWLTSKKKVEATSEMDDWPESGAP